MHKRFLSKGVAVVALALFLITPSVSHAYFLENQISPIIKSIGSVFKKAGGQLATVLTAGQVDSVLDSLVGFGASESVIANVSNALNGGTALPGVGLSESEIVSVMSLLGTFGADAALVKNIDYALHGSAVAAPPSAEYVVASLDASSPGFQLVSAGSVGVVLGAFKFRAAGEDVILKSVRIALAGDPTTVSPADITRLTLWDGSTQVGEGIFSNDSFGTVAQLTDTFRIPKDLSKILTVKSDLAKIGTGQPGRSGDLIKLGLQYGFGDFYGVGVTSGRTYDVTGDSAITDGAQLFKSFPVVSMSPLPTTGVADGRLMRFKVSADPSGPVSLGKLTFSLADNSGEGGNFTITNFALYAFTDAVYSSPVSGQGTAGQVGAVIATPGNPLTFGPTNPLTIPAGQTRYFELRASVTSTTGASVTTTLLGDPVFIYPQSGIALREKTHNFVWSPNSTTTSPFSNNDWTNGYRVPGLPSSGLVFSRADGTGTSLLTCTLSASPSTVTAGGTSTLSWTTVNATSFSINGGIGSVAPATGGSKSVTVATTTTYIGTASGSSGSVTCSATVKVGNKPAVPTITATTTTTSVGRSVIFTFKATDLDKDRINYHVDWTGDKVEDEVAPASGFVNSGTSQTISHTWTTAGTYTVYARTRDATGLLSSWSAPFTITVLAVPPYWKPL